MLHIEESGAPPDGTVSNPSHTNAPPQPEPDEEGFEAVGAGVGIGFGVAIGAAVVSTEVATTLQLEYRIAAMAGTH